MKNLLDFTNFVNENISTEGRTTKDEDGNPEQEGNTIINNEETTEIDEKN